MMLIFISVLALSTVPIVSTVSATPTQSVMPVAPVVTAQEAFAAGVASRQDAATARAHFAEAARLFDQNWADGHRSASLAINRSRAHVLAEDTAGAILALHAAREQTPWNVELQQELERVRDTVAYPEGLALRPAPPHQLRDRFSPLAICIWASVACACVMVGYIVRAVVRAWWAYILLITGIIGILIACGVMGIIAATSPEPRRCVVTATDGVLPRSGNGWAFPPCDERPYPAGIEGWECHRRGGWVQVEWASGQIGWLPESAIRWRVDE